MGGTQQQAPVATATGAVVNPQGGGFGGFSGLLNMIQQLAQQATQQGTGLFGGQQPQFAQQGTGQVPMDNPSAQPAPPAQQVAPNPGQPVAQQAPPRQSPFMNMRDRLAQMSQQTQQNRAQGRSYIARIWGRPSDQQPQQGVQNQLQNQMNARKNIYSRIRVSPVGGNINAVQRKVMETTGG